MSIQPHDANSTAAMRRLGTCLRGKYQLDRLLGIGGMGAVFAARHRIGGSYAIKILHRTVAGGAGMHDAFLREALLANRVDHPGAVRVIDADVAEDGSPFYVMPLLQGETLRRRAARAGGRLPTEEVVAFALSVLGTLTVAHEKRIVHRDIKPENLFLTRSDGLKVLDFGIARMFDAPQSEATHSGRAVGTPAFMAPEQALGQLRQIDGRTDLWSVGATMFLLLSGRCVHEGDTWSEIAAYAATRPARPLSSVAPDAPAALREVVDRALRFSKKERWLNAVTMSDALREACIHANVAVREPFTFLPPPDSPTDSIHAHVTEPSRVATERLDDRITTTGATAAAHQRRLLAKDARRDALNIQEFVPNLNDQVSLGGPTATMPLSMRRPSRTVAVRAATIAAGACVAAFCVVAATKGLIRNHFANAPSQRKLTDAGFAHSPSQVSSTAPASSEENGDVEEALRTARAGSFKAARIMLDRASENGKTAAADLWFALFSEFADPSAREHYQRAVSHSDKLTERQQQALGALGPWMSDTSNPVETARRLDDLARGSTDIDLCIGAAFHLVTVREHDAALRHIDSILSQRPSTGAAWLLKAQVLARTNESSAPTYDALERCLAVSPSSEGCAISEALLLVNSGRCDELVTLARRMVNTAPQSARSYHALGVALFGQTESTELARAALVQRWARLQGDNAAWNRAWDETSLATLDGNFELATTKLQEWEDRGDAIGGESSHSAAIEAKMTLLLERGKFDEAASLARATLKRRAAWEPTDHLDRDIFPVGTLYLAGAISNDELRVRREDWWRRSLSKPHLSEADRWATGYAAMVRTPADADEALRHLPASDPFESLLDREESASFDIGRTYLLAGHVADAIRFLTPAAQSCSITNPVARMRAKLHLGLALEQQGQHEEACARFQFVANAWSNAKDSTTRAQALEGLRRLNCK